MNITVYSNNRLRESASKWNVPGDFANPMLNYLVYGYEPGSCFTAVLANDFFRAIQSSHPSNTVEAFKFLTGWIRDRFPPEAHGSYDSVRVWCQMSESRRRSILERDQLIYTEQEEMIKTLKAEDAWEPVLY
jgi:hypothetical protein